jgi:hypothetical protein
MGSLDFFCVGKRCDDKWEACFPAGWRKTSSLFFFFMDALVTAGSRSLQFAKHALAALP